MNKLIHKEQDTSEIKEFRHRKYELNVPFFGRSK
jgi:hypothetical protein